MTQLMLEAIKALRQLPAERLDEVARAVLLLTGRDSRYQSMLAKHGRALDHHPVAS